MTEKGPEHISVSPDHIFYYSKLVAGQEHGSGHL